MTKYRGERGRGGGGRAGCAEPGAISAAAPSEASVRDPSQKRGWGLEEGESGYARGQGHSELGQRDLRGLGITCWQGCALSLTPPPLPLRSVPFLTVQGTEGLSRIGKGRRESRVETFSC